MKTKTPLLAMLFALATFRLFASPPSGDWLTWLGSNSGQDATGAQSEFFGAKAGQNAIDIYRTVFLGIMAGYGAERISNCFSAGAASMANASDCDNCVFIGPYAGQRANGVSYRTQINGQLYIDKARDEFYVSPDPAKPSVRAPLSYSSGTMRVNANFAIETTAANRLAFESADAHVWLSACDGNDAYDGLSPTSAVKTIMGAYNAAYNAATNGILNASNEIVVAVAEGCYAPCVIYSALTNGIAYVATGDRKDTIIDGMMATDGTETLGSPYNRAVVVGVRMACPDVLYSVSMRGFTLTRFNHYYRGDFSVRSQVVYGIKFSKCDFTANDAMVREDSAFASGIFDECDFHGNRLRCRRQFAVDAFFGGNSGWSIYGDDVVLSRCHVWDNDMSICTYLMRFHAYRSREVSHCLLEVDFYNSRVDPHELAHHNTVIAKTIANPYVTGVDEYSYAPGFGSGPSNSNFIVLSRQPDTYAGQPVYGIGDSCIVSNANLTADFVAADPSCPSVRSDGQPDYGYKDSGLWQYKSVPEWAKADESFVPGVVTNIVRDLSLGGIWDEAMEVWWTPRMRNGSLTYEATTNVNLNAEN